MLRETTTILIPTGAYGHALHLDTSAWNLLKAVVRVFVMREAPLDEVINKVSHVLSPSSDEMAFLEQVKFLQDSEDTPLTVVVSSETMEFCVEDVVGKFW